MYTKVRHALVICSLFSCSFVLPAAAASSRLLFVLLNLQSGPKTYNVSFVGAHLHSPFDQVRDDTHTM